MTRTIAYTRLFVYTGASIGLVAELLRLILILVSALLSSPFLYSILQNFIYWGLLASFSCITLGFYRLLISDPALLDPEGYPLPILQRAVQSCVIILIILIGLILIPPSDFVSQDIQNVVSAFRALLWSLYHSTLVAWIILNWLYINKSDNLKKIIVNRRISIQVVSGSVLSVLWLMESFYSIIFQFSLLEMGITYFLYYITVLIFLILQLYYFYDLTRFSFNIIG
ncbi:MAG: hypothetical protein ACTSP4_02105 [Candidatus Hodarchaeales archaeon]